MRYNQQAPRSSLRPVACSYCGVSSSPRRWRGACIKATFAVIAPERELAWTGVAMGWIKAIDRFRLAPTGDGQTTVTMEETMSGPLLTLFYNDLLQRRQASNILPAGARLRRSARQAPQPSPDLAQIYSGSGPAAAVPFSGLNSVSAAGPVQIPLSLLFFELSDHCVNTVQLHVNAADVLVRSGIDGDGFR